LDGFLPALNTILKDMEKYLTLNTDVHNLNENN
jgi:hypothetical protein